MERGKGILIPAAQYGLMRINPAQRTKIKLSGELTSLLISLDPIVIKSLQSHALGDIVPRAQKTLYHAQVVPLVAKGETVGALCLFKPKGDEFRLEDQETA